MDTILNDVLELYGEGLAIVDIADTLGLTYDDTLEKLREYRKSQRVRGRYTDEIMKLIALRDCKKVTRKQIMFELGVSRSLLAKAIENFGFMKTTREADVEELYATADESFVFTNCLGCNSKHINEIQTLHGLKSVEGIYCLDCGNEFFKDGNEIYIVKWENLD